MRRGNLLKGESKFVDSPMTPIKQITSKYKSTYAAAKALNVSATQLDRWVKADALIDDDGNVWIKTKGKVVTNKHAVIFKGVDND